MQGSGILLGYIGHLASLLTCEAGLSVEVKTRDGAQFEDSLLERS